MPSSPFQGKSWSVESETFVCLVVMYFFTFMYIYIRMYTFIHIHAEVSMFHLRRYRIKYTKICHYQTCIHTTCKVCVRVQEDMAEAFRAGDLGQPFAFKRDICLSSEVSEPVNGEFSPKACVHMCVLL